MAMDPITAAIDAGKTILDKIWPDAGEAERNRVQLALAMFASQAEIVKAEAQSDSWMAANWRPLTMLTFTGLIVARWFGLAAPNLTDMEYLALWDIVQVGLGGYVFGRTAEKIVPSIADAIKHRK